MERMKEKSLRGSVWAGEPATSSGKSMARRGGLASAASVGGERVP
jgi:hypothetical protein